jgi:hypothetical protein
VKATIQAKEAPGQVSTLYPYIQPAVDQAGANLEAATKANAKIQAGLLRQASTVIAGFGERRKAIMTSLLGRLTIRLDRQISILELRFL